MTISTTIAELSAQDTARWISGENVEWTDGLRDKEKLARLKTLKRELKRAFNKANQEGLDAENELHVFIVAERLVAVLDSNGSEQTAKRLEELVRARDLRLVYAMLHALSILAGGQEEARKAEQRRLLAGRTPVLLDRNGREIKAGLPTAPPGPVKTPPGSVPPDTRGPKRPKVPRP